MVAIAAATLFSANSISATYQTSNFNAYVRDGSDKVIRTGGNSCLHSSEWKSGMFECPATVVPVVIEYVEKKPKIVKVIVEETEFFDFNQTELKPGAQAKLLKLVNMVKTPDEFSKISVFGYTDRIGSDEYNMNLSKKRAETVRDFLVNQNKISAEKVEVIAMGKKNPRVNCEGVRGKKPLINCLGHNRRVEILLSFDKSIVE